MRARAIFAGWTWITHPLAAAVLLAAFAVLMLASVRDKSLTFDEIAHAAGGYASLRVGDFRLQPENGPLPQYLAGWALRDYPFPSLATDAWRQSDVWGVGFEWFFESGNDGAQMTWRARLACSVFAVALGGVVWAWSRRLFGRVGAMLSLVLYVLSPTVLANGPLITSDLAAALFFTTSAWAMWELAHHISLRRLLVCGASLAGLFLSKMSAAVILPLGLAIIVVKLVSSKPLVIEIRIRREEPRRLRQATVFGLVAAVLAVAVGGTIWAGYGFRYSMFSSAAGGEGRLLLPWDYVLGKPDLSTVCRELELSPAQQEKTERILFEHGVTEPLWTDSAKAAMEVVKREVLTEVQRDRYVDIVGRPAPGLAGRGLEFFRRHELLPEAWIYGTAHVLALAQARAAFLNGEVRTEGWWWFFPYTFAVKTPLGFFAVAALAILAARGRRPRAAADNDRDGAQPSGLYALAPLWILVLGYGAIVMTSNLNIGHRHLLPAYPAMFILCGAAAGWFGARSGTGAASGWKQLGPGRRMARVVLGASLLALAVDVLGRFPNYLAYFNGIVAPKDAYRHLVDSSLDWGQELPAVKRYLDQRPAEGPFYLSYFGTASPGFYGIDARPLYSNFGLHLRHSPDFAVLRLPAESAEAQLARFQERRPDFDVVDTMPDGREFVAAVLRKTGALRLEPGTYVISATMLQMVHRNFPDTPRGRWTAKDEAAYQSLVGSVAALLSDDPTTRWQGLLRHPSNEWPGLLERFKAYRFGRLAAFLRQREPDDQINNAMLVYRLNAGDLKKALGGPPPGI